MKKLPCLFLVVGLVMAVPVVAQEPPLQASQKALFAGEPQQAVDVLKTAVQ
ncbi:MAG: hypothetical protein HYS05_09465, partial [Acidobacteria bacterium]|nr:hypothetical protein [Acidobacteriota bacterium]